MADETERGVNRDRRGGRERIDVERAVNPLRNVQHPPNHEVQHRERGHNSVGRGNAINQGRNHRQGGGGRGRGSRRDNGTFNRNTTGRSTGGRGENRRRDEQINRRRGRIIGYRKLTEWNQIDNSDELVIEMIGAKENIEFILNDHQLKEDWIKLLVEIFSKCCQATAFEMKVSVLTMLKESVFLRETLQWYMTYIGMDGSEDDKRTLCEQLIILIDTFLKLFPSNFMDMPVDRLIILATKVKDRADLQEKIAEIELERNLQLRKEKREKEHFKRNKGFTEEPPPNDYRELPTHPTCEEIQSRVEPYLRPIKEKGSYDDGAHYLDIQFRLLKEDLVAPLRSGIREVIENVPRKDRKHGLKIYNGIDLLYENCTQNGITHCIRFDTANTQKMPWRHSRRLIYGSLLCLSSDNFKTMVLATVADRNPKNLENGLIDIRFVDGYQACHYFRGSSAKAQMVESESYFEAYKHVLDGIKEIEQTKVPMEKYLIRCENEGAIPRYLDGKQPQYTFDNIILSTDRREEINFGDDDNDYGVGKKSSKQIRILQNRSWPRYDLTTLNESQLCAFKHALTNEFAVIQGPPGTGKTYVGLRIADALLKNREYWDDGDQAPMLIVCYTNHALDQFLQGLIKLGHKEIIRVGGRASEDMSEFALKHAVRNADRDKIVGFRRAKAVAHREKGCVEQELERSIIGLKIMHDNCFSQGKVLFLNHLQHVISKEHLEYLEDFDYQCRQIKLSVFDIFLELWKVPPETLQYLRHEEVMPLGDETKIINVSEGENKEEDDKQVEIDAEGEVLVERWANDHNQFRRRIRQSLEEELSLQSQQDRTRSIFKDEDGFEIVPPSKKQRQRLINRNINVQPMNDEEADEVENPWVLKLEDKWRLYQYWLRKFSDCHSKNIEEKARRYDNACKVLKELNEQEEEQVMKKATVVAMTTTCAAKYRRVLNNIKPKIVIIEEAAEVLEAHVVTSLTPESEHVILIGDHKQLKPNPSVYKLATKYQLEVSLFERMVNNGLQCQTLDVQHRMRPEIARLIQHVYPSLKNAKNVLEYPNVKGIESNVMFISHTNEEHEIQNLKSKANKHEASFIAGLCKYLLQQGYQPSQITILAGYTGQLIELKNLMPRKVYEGVRITAVDNFQGEENDIILLSLVRSNLDGKIGFLGTENRVCVALSRAKHGLYVIGNFELLEKQSPMWNKILSDVKDMDSLKTGLTLCCQNHPKTKIIVSRGEDFKEAPEGGCKKPCGFRLDCGHCCQSVCHPKDPEHKDYICLKQCLKQTCDDGHTCKKQCHNGRQCGTCLHPVEKIIPRCGHKVIMSCGDDPNRELCQVRCTRIRKCGHNCQGLCGQNCEEIQCSVMKMRNLICGHTVHVPCSIPNEEIVCKEPCKSTLECTHKCPGTCGSCKRGRLHQKCRTDCKRVLICSHICKERCTTGCPPCKDKCKSSCVHSTCHKQCGALCVPCREECMWRCPHFQCTKACYEDCDRPPCKHPCPERIYQCQHPCIGLCGEKCPKLCRICNKEEVEEIFFGSEDEPDARFIVLPDCGHIFEVNGMDQWMETTNESSTDDMIKLKECPKCKTVIRRSLRYGNIVKKTLRDIEAVKSTIINTNGNFKQMRMDLLKKMRTSKIVPLKINGIVNEIINCFLMGKRIDENVFYGHYRDFMLSFCRGIYACTDTTAVNRYENQLKTMEQLEDIKEIIKKRKGGNIILKKDLMDVEKYIKTDFISNDQMKQALIEIFRIDLHSQLSHYKSDIKEQAKPLEVSHTILQLLREFESSDFITEDRLKEVDQIIKNLQKQYGLDGITREEKEMIIKAMKLGKGHWYKCRNGHFYAIGECGGANQTGRCPECNETIGGQSHHLAAGNQHAGEFDNSQFAAYSEEANNPDNWDQEMLRRLQME